MKTKRTETKNVTEEDIQEAATECVVEAFELKAELTDSCGKIANLTGLPERNVEALLLRSPTAKATRAFDDAIKYGIPRLFRAGKIKVEP